MSNESAVKLKQLSKAKIKYNNIYQEKKHKKYKRKNMNFKENLNY